MPVLTVRSSVARRRGKTLLAALIVASIASVAACARAQVFHHAMVVSESPQGAQAGVEILKHGGNAVDAAVAAELASCVTNSVSCGIGGGGFMLIYMARQHAFYALDYRETAPLAATATMYVRDGKPDEHLARTGGLAVAVPGDIAGLSAALHRFGRLKFSTVAAPAIKLAGGGFPLTEHLAKEIAWVAPRIAHDPGLRATFLDRAGKPDPPGSRSYNKALAATLTRLGDHPARNFYHGPIAEQLVAFIRAHGGIITTADLAAYKPVWRTPLHLAYQGDEVYAVPPPSSGGVLLEMLGMLADGRLAGLGVDSPPYLARLIEVMREGFIDRQQYADPAFVHVPIEMLLSPAHIAQARERALHRRTPPATVAAHDHGTLSLCVVDAAGNAVALTTTINTIFGAKLMDPELGVILNNEMDDFAVAPGVRNVFRLAGAKANEIAPGKRPLSSMTPVIVARGGAPIFVAGGSGGPTILTGVLQVALNTLDFHLSPQKAVDEPRIHEQASPDVVLVEAAMATTTITALKQMGYKIRVLPHLGAVGVIDIEPGHLRGAFDPRKGGAAAGY